MKLVRSWPAVIPEGRSYIVDDIPKLVMSDYDYRCLLDLDDDVVLIEWDIAVGGQDLETFMARAAANPNQVRVAPYLLYPKSTSSRHGPFYVHRSNGYGSGARRYVTGPEQATCDMFGFGLVYLPRALMVEFVAQLPANKKFTDTTFSYWHRRRAPRELRDVPIDWDIVCVHLHYDLPEVPT